MAEECRINVDAMKKRQEIIQQTDDEVAASKGHACKSRNKHLWESDEDKKLLVRELKTQKNHTNGERDQSDITVTKIQRVPDIMRQNGKFEEYYKPRKLAIGPIHAADSDLSKSNYIKIKLAAKLINDNGQTWESLLEVVRKDIEKLKNCFDEEVITGYDDESLAWMLFLDGCAVLQFIYSYVNSPNEFKEMEISNDEAVLIQQDLFSLENQIPYYLLKQLMDQFEGNDIMKSHSTAIKILVAKSNIIAPIMGYWIAVFVQNLSSLTARLEQSNLPVHLLDLLLCILDGDNEDNNGNSNDKANCLSCINCFGSEPNGTGFFKDMLKILKNMYHDDGIRYSFRNIHELKSAGVKLKPSDYCSMRSVSFTRGCFTLTGSLQIPPLIVKTTTVRKLMNLVAFERLLDKEYIVTSYLKLLGSLIDTEKDVMELRRANVLRHRLGSDKEVARLFDSLGSDILLLPNQDIYEKVARRVDRHCQRKSPIWIAQFRRDNCSSPWTIAAYVLAIIGAYMSLRTFYNAMLPNEGELVNGIADFFKLS